MGQYHLICNMDRREFLYSHTFGDGLKLMEFGCNGEGMMTGLAILLAASNGRGGGDLHIWTPSATDPRGESPWYGEREGQDAPGEYALRLQEHVIGRWAGDRIAIVGDYFEPADVPGFDLEASNPWQHEHGSEQAIQVPEDQRWTDISHVVLDAMKMDHYTAKTIRERQERYGGVEAPKSVLTPDGKIIPTTAAKTA